MMPSDRSSLSSSSSPSSSLSDSTDTGSSFLSASICNRQKARRSIRGRPLFGIDESNDNSINNNHDGTIRQQYQQQNFYYYSLLRKRLYIPPPVGSSSSSTSFLEGEEEGRSKTTTSHDDSASNAQYNVIQTHQQEKKTLNSLSNIDLALSDLQKAILIDCLSNHFLFGQLSTDQLEVLVLKEMEKCIYKKHEIIIQQGRHRGVGVYNGENNNCIINKSKNNNDDDDDDNDVAEHFYILFSGDLRITQDGKVVGPDGNHEGHDDRVKGNNAMVDRSSDSIDNSKYTVFGDLAVLTGTPYPVTVQAMSPTCTLFRLGRRAFHRALLKSHSSDMSSMKTIQERLALFKQDLPKELADHLLDHPDILNQLVSHLTIQSFVKGDTLVDKNQVLDSLVIIVQGKVVATEISLGGRSDYEDMVIGPGESRISFGWQSLIGSSTLTTTKSKNSRRRLMPPKHTSALFHGTVVAKTDGTALLLSKEDFRNAISVVVGGDGIDDDGGDARLTSIKSMLSALAARRLARIQLQEIPIFKDSALDEIQIKGLLDLMHRCEYDEQSNLDHDYKIEWKDGEVDGESLSSSNNEDMTIFKVGDKVEAAMYFIREGGVTLLMDKGRTQQTIEAGGYFGEKNLLLDQNKDNRKHYVSRSTITAIAHTPRTVLDVLYLEECRTVIDTRYLGLGTNTPSTTAMDTAVQWSGLKLHRLLGSGTFGQVWLASLSPSSPIVDNKFVSSSASSSEEVDTAGTTQSTVMSDDGDGGRTFVALKVHAKYRLVQTGYASRMVAERNILASLNSPFILRLLYSFQDDSRLYMITPVLEGGELESILSNDCVPEPVARFYSAGVLEALTYMHRKHLIHRDIKTSNIMIKSNGYPVLIDFGFGKSYIPSQ
jgi:CRP-like cAMP-binding protein